MRAVWTAARAAVRRRRLQTFVIGLVVFLSTATIVVALALLDASSAPFDRAFAAQQGPHVVATYDPALAGTDRLAAARTGVSAVAGPFDQAVVEPARSDSVFVRGSMRLAGRAGPDGPVDRLNLWRGRWATGPGEIVLNEPPPGEEDFPLRLFDEAPPVVIDGVTLRVVGWAHSLSRSADG